MFTRNDGMELFLVQITKNDVVAAWFCPWIYYGANICCYYSRTFRLPHHVTVVEAYVFPFGDVKNWIKTVCRAIRAAFRVGNSGTVSHWSDYRIHDHGIVLYFSDTCKINESSSVHAWHCRPNGTRSSVIFIDLEFVIEKWCTTRRRWMSAQMRCLNRDFTVLLEKRF